MAEAKGSTLLYILLVLLCLISFRFAIAAPSGTGYGVGSFLLLLSSESLLMSVTKCMCFGKHLAPGSDRAWSIVYFISSWITFLTAEACLIAGPTKNAYHTKYLKAGTFSCESLRKGIFIAGAVFLPNLFPQHWFTKLTDLVH